MHEVPTLRNVAGLPSKPNALADSALIMIDCQNTYREGIMALSGVEAALAEGQRLLEHARRLGVPVIHIQHDAGPGSPYDIRAEIGRIAGIVAPAGAEPVLVKNYPSSFVGTDLHERLQKLGVKNLVVAGFMTHMCVNSTVRGAFDLGYAATVVAKATATRPLPLPTGKVVSAEAVQDSSLAAMGDLFAVVVESADEVVAPPS